MKHCPSSHTPAWLVASVYARLGEKDEAFAWLDRAFQQRDFRMTKIRRSFEFDSLRWNPRYPDSSSRLDCRLRVSTANRRAAAPTSIEAFSGTASD